MEAKKIADNERHKKWFNNKYKNDAAFREKLAIQRKENYERKKLLTCEVCDSGLHTINKCVTCKRVTCSLCRNICMVHNNKIVIICNDCKNVIIR